MSNPERKTNRKSSGDRKPRRESLTLVLALAWACVFVPGSRPALAATFTVNDTSDRVDTNPGNGTCRASNNRCTLRAAIQEANALSGADTINLPSGTYELAIAPLNQNGITTGDFDITGPLTIIGAGAGSSIVDGGVPKAGSPPEVRGLDRLFDVQANQGTVTFSGLTIRDGYAAEYGGGIFNGGTATVTVTACSLTGNVAGKTGGAIDNHVDGVVNVNGSTISGNFAGESGSALNNNRGGRLTVTNSTVSANSGAAIGRDPALSGAGAISNNAELDSRGTLIVTASLVHENIAGGGNSGGGISNDGAGIVQVDRTTFSKNRTEVDGGAIFNSGGELTVTDSSFSENVAENGGAIANDIKEALATIRNSTFSLNSALLRGGGVSNSGLSHLIVTGSTFTRNSAGDGGGGIVNDDKGSTTIQSSVFTENSALSGAGFASGGGTVAITGTRFFKNTAEGEGGGILVDSGNVRMLGIDVIENVANAGGGVAYQGDGAVSVGESAAIEGSRIHGNRAIGPGGGIDSRGDGGLAVTTTSIVENTAAIGGGINHDGDASLHVTRSTLSGNFAEFGGGLFTDGDGEATLENVTVSGNRAGQSGGGVLVNSRLTMASSTVADNSAPTGGGVSNEGGSDGGDGSAFLRNTIVANNPVGGNCAGIITSLGGNIDNADTCRFREPSDQPGTDPRIGPLADNGGPTQTHALLEGSPAQDTALCTESSPCPSLDQRGVVRPQGAGYDIGAYESGLLPEPPPDATCAGRSERTVLASGDSWITEGAPGNNFGGDSILKVRSQSGAGNFRALVRFELPPVPPGCEIVGATLRLHSSSATVGRTLEAARIASPWSETGVTWANQPLTAGPVATTGSGLDYREWSVTGQTQDMYSGDNQGFLIRDAAEGGLGFEQSFHSREKGTDRPPELVLIFDSPDADPTCPSAAQTLSPDSDSWVNQGSPGNNFGADSVLKVKSQSGGANSRALVRFPLPPLPAGCTGVASATLRLHAGSATTGRTLEALRIASSWTEAGVSWSNQPAVTGVAATAPSGLDLLEWSVTDQVGSMYSAGNHGFLIRDAAESGTGDEQGFHSREKAPDNPPTLVITFE